MSQVPAKVEILTEEEYHALAEKEMNDTFTSLADRARPYPVPRKVGRKNVENAFHTAFELIGGVPRFALWADAQPTEFYKLYSRFVPQEMNTNLDAVIRIVVPKSPLDD